MTPERKAQLFAELDAEFGHLKRTKEVEAKLPKVVASEGRVVAAASVRVSPADPNFQNSSGGFVKIDMAAYERQRAWAEHDRAVWARRQRELDPYRLGHWGAWED